MPEFEQSIVVDTPVEPVAEFMATVENWPTTNPSIIEVSNVEDHANGSTADLTYRMVGIKIPGTVEVDVREPNEHIVASFTGPGLTGDVEYQLTPVADGTKVVQRVNYEFTGSVLDKVIEPVAASYNRRQFDSVLTNTKELIEAQAASEA